MSAIWWVVAVGAVLWLLLVLHVWTRQHHLSADEVRLNPKVNLGRCAAVHSIQGHRPHMEDAYYGDHTKGFFAVFGQPTVKPSNANEKCASVSVASLLYAIIRFRTV